MNKLAARDATFILLCVLVGLAAIVGGLGVIFWLVVQSFGGAGLLALVATMCLAGLWLMIYSDVKRRDYD